MLLTSPARTEDDAIITKGQGEGAISQAAGKGGETEDAVSQARARERMLYHRPCRENVLYHRPGMT